MAVRTGAPRRKPEAGEGTGAGRLFAAYRAFHEQGFVPIFVQDDLDSRSLVEACVAAGCRGIEVTLRRRDAPTLIPWIRAQHPDLYLLVGSTLDDDGIVAHARKRHPQLRTLAELAALGVDGFVSMIGWRPETISRYASTHLVIPSASTLTEAFQEVGAGAHFVKFLGPDLGLVRACRGDATFGFCPVFVTGGMALERIPDAFAAGAVMVGAGFDLILREEARPVSDERITAALKRHLAAAAAAREKHWPRLAEAIGGDRSRWLEALPHGHPF